QYLLQNACGLAWKPKPKSYVHEEGRRKCELETLLRLGKTTCSSIKSKSTAMRSLPRNLSTSFMIFWKPLRTILAMIDLLYTLTWAVRRSVETQYLSIIIRRVGR